MSFPCTQCGQCCKNISDITALEDYDSGNGICKHYNKANGCDIYHTRPMVCRIDEGYTTYFSKVISLENYYQENLKVCNQLQITNGIDKIFRVKL